MRFSKIADHSMKVGSLALILSVADCTSKSESSSNDAQHLAASDSQATRTTTAQSSATTPSSSTPAPTASGAAVIQSQDTNTPGVVGELIDCKRADGVLTIKVRFRNTSDKRIEFPLLAGRLYEQFYVTAASKKYFILKDSEGTYLTTQTDSFGTLGVRLEPGQSFVWWAKYPAPPAEIKKVNLLTPIAPPFEDIPITDG
jgi:hypothetical protein